MKNKKIGIKQIIAYWIIVFIGLPFFLLYFTKFIQDFGWYLVYFVIIFPVISICSLVLLWNKLKKENSKVLFYSLLLVWLYRGLQSAFGGISW